MNMKKTFLILLALLITLGLSAHPWKPNHYVIIDTDGGIDDMRAICMLLASPDVRVLGITVSPGALNAETAYIKVKSLLNSFYHEGIPVGINRSKVFKSPDFQSARQYNWGIEKGIDPTNAPDHIKIISNILTFEKTPVTFVCLGGMTTASSALMTITEFSKQVKEIVWSCDGLDDKKGFNYNIDKTASDLMLDNKLPVKAVTGSIYEIYYESDLISVIGKTNTIYAKKLSAFFKSETSDSHSFERRLTDELVPVFLHWPDLFTSRIEGNNSEFNPADLMGIREGFKKIISGETVNKNQVINRFPTDPAFYSSDVEPYVSEIIQKYGEDEWISGVIANELHRHLGVFAIIGVKMGIRAREYFDTGVDEFKALSFAGSVPPLSCMNDGIQVSTGATPGHGLLTVSNDSVTKPSAEFTYLDHRIRLTLNPEIAKKLSDELKEINFVYGLDSNIYWELVRKNSIKYWKELDRHDIFIIENL
jgi:pyrimidine-specific ribonucleoside hydrolase